MRSEEIRIGTAYTCQVGRNAIRVTVTEAAGNGGWIVATHTGRTMAVRNADLFLAPADAPAAAESPAPAGDTPQTGPSQAGAPERDSGEQGAPGGEAGGTMSLLDAAARILGQADGSMPCKDLVERARGAGMWAPKRGGKTPDRTLYAAILREIAARGDASRFAKTERGRFSLRA